MSKIRPNSLVSIIIAATLVLGLEPSSSVAAGPAITTNTQSVNTILNGKFAPTSAIGKNGDFYIDIKNLIFYGLRRMVYGPQESL